MKDGIKQIKALSKKLENYPDYVIEGHKEEAQQSYDKALAFVNGHSERFQNDIIVSVEKEEGVRRIVATGKDVGFVEYGSGFGAVHNNDAPIPTGPDTWSSTHAQQFHKYQKWKFNKKTYYSILATKSLHNIVTYLKRYTQRKARKYFD